MGMTHPSYACCQTLGTPSLAGYKPEIIFRDERNGVSVDCWKAHIPLRCHASSFLAAGQRILACLLMRSLRMRCHDKGSAKRFKNQEIDSNFHNECIITQLCRECRGNYLLVFW